MFINSILDCIPSVYSDKPLFMDEANQDIVLQLLLDCSKATINLPIHDCVKDQIEGLSRKFIYKLHMKRCQILRNLYEEEKNES